MTLTEEFQRALASTAADLPGPELLPQRLARACARVLPVDGAGISLFFAAGRRLPLGASDPVAAEAERLQFTLGEGPCLSSHATGDVVLADEATLRSRWPGYYDALAAGSPIRGSLSLPLHDELHGIGALDLFVVPPRDVGSLSVPDAQVVSEQVAAALQGQARPSGLADGPAWLDAPAAGQRAAVWQAIGYLTSALGVTGPDALALLRAHAYAAGQSVDHLAGRVLSRGLPVEELALDADTPR